VERALRFMQKGECMGGLAMRGSESEAVIEMWVRRFALMGRTLGGDVNTKRGSDGKI
jgi:hypothetical protein